MRNRRLLNLDVQYYYKGNSRYYWIEPEYKLK